MTIDDKTEDFEVIRNEEEHENNDCHKYLKYAYNYYRRMGLGKRLAIKYAKWNYQNVILPQREKK